MMEKDASVWWAEMKGHTETVRALLKAGAAGRDYSFLDARGRGADTVRLLKEWVARGEL